MLGEEQIVKMKYMTESEIEETIENIIKFRTGEENVERGIQVNTRKRREFRNRE